MIPFNKPYLTGDEIGFISDAHSRGQLAGDGFYTHKCSRWLEERIGCSRALLTHSCTAALEMCALLLDIQEGDEIVMPSYTFVSTANAFAKLGATPVFVDIRRDTQNINECLIEAAITHKTRAIVVVHYAGVSCEMETIIAVGKRHGLVIIEDAAQGILSQYKGKSVGSLGHLACLSFHETKNVVSGEGGALLINDDQFIERAEIIREKGTDRSKFFRGEVDKYTWVDLGSSYLPGELIAAFLWGQLVHAEEITRRRLEIWWIYKEGLEKRLLEHGWTTPIVPDECRHNAHMFQLLAPDEISRDCFIKSAKRLGLHTVFHYQPLHKAPYGIRIGRSSGVDKKLPVTDFISERLVRIPLWVGVEARSVVRLVLEASETHEA